MSKATSLIILTILLIRSLNGNAQINLSFGLEGAHMQGNFQSVSSFAYGGTIGVEIGLSNKSGLTSSTGYLHLVPTEEYTSGYGIPTKSGTKKLRPMLHFSIC